MVTIKKAWILYLHEGRILLRQPQTYWILAANLFIVNTLTLVSSKFFDTAHATMLPLFVNVPLISALFIPLLTMTQWAKPKSLEALPWFFSFPLPLWSVVLARFALAWSIGLIALFGTFPLSFTLSYLGSPDWGTIGSGYIILAALSAFQVAWGSLASALAPHVLAAYVLAATGNVFFLGLGSHLLYEKIPTLLPFVWNERLSPLGVPYHLIAAFRGVLDLRDGLYFLAWTLLCLYLNQSILYNKRKQRRPGRTTIFAYLSVTTGIFLLVLLARDAHVRWDLTEENLYTLSGGTKDIIERLEKPVHADFYFTRSNIPSSMKHYGQRIEELLREYAATSPKTFRLRLIDPIQDSEEEVQARIAGMHAVTGPNGENSYLGLALRQGDHSLSIPLFNVQTEAQLEYELTESIVRLAQAAKPSLGIMSELPLVGDELGENSTLRNDWAFISALRSLYQIVSVPIAAESIPETLQTLILVHPKNLNNKTLYAIDQFLMRGGKMLVFLDAFCRFEINYPNGGQNHNSFSSQLTHFLEPWGVIFHNETLVGDESRAMHVQMAQMSYDYPFQMQLIEADMNHELSISKSLQKINLLEAGWFEIKKDAPYSFEPLITAGESSGLVKTDLTEYMSPQQITAELKPDGESRIVAGLLKGRWKSTFKAAPDGSFFGYKAQAEQEGAIVVVSDVDFLTDAFTVDKIQTMGQMVYKPKGDNISFIMNALEFINGHQDLIAIRSRIHVDRSLKRIVAIERRVAEQFQGKDATLAARLAEIQEKLSQWEGQQSNEVGQVVSKEQLLTIQELRESEAKVRRERRLLKDATEAQLDHLKTNIMILHMGFAPLTVLLGLFWVWRQRWKTQRLVPPIS
ncbi:MAG: Gldg family protein [Chitinophagaceae bacterium]|nr:Gldg family protein [Oligoflexus sp.]